MSCAISDVRTVEKDILSGQDGLGSVVKVLSARSARVDRFFHCLAPVGFACADRHRVPLLLLACLLGVACFASATIGALGLGTFGMRTFPWSAYDDVPLRLFDLYWWSAGPNGTIMIIYSIYS